MSYNLERALLKEQARVDGLTCKFGIFRNGFKLYPKNRSIKSCAYSPSCFHGERIWTKVVLAFEGWVKLEGILVPATLPWEGPDSSYILVSYLIFVAFSVYTEWLPWSILNVLEDFAILCFMLWCAESRMCKLYGDQQFWPQLMVLQNILTPCSDLKLSQDLWWSFCFCRWFWRRWGRGQLLGSDISQPQPTTDFQLLLSSSQQQWSLWEYWAATFNNCFNPCRSTSLLQTSHFTSTRVWLPGWAKFLFPPYSQIPGLQCPTHLPGGDGAVPAPSAELSPPCQHCPARGDPTAAGLQPLQAHHPEQQGQPLPHPTPAAAEPPPCHSVPCATPADVPDTPGAADTGTWLLLAATAKQVTLLFQLCALSCKDFSSL